MDNNWQLMKEGVKGVPSPENWIISVLPEGGLVGIDPKLISAERFNDLRKTLAMNDVCLVEVEENLVDLVSRGIRQSRPVHVLPLCFCGQSWQSKVRALRTQMASSKANLLFLTALDQIAWTFNLRGSDIEYNPVFFAYAIIGMDFVSLFVDEKKVSKDVLWHLNCVNQKKPSPEQEMAAENEQNEDQEISVSLYPYVAVRDYLSKYASQTLARDKVWLPIETTSQATASVVSKEKRLLKSSPVLLMKAVKNETELNGMRNAHIKDSIAHCEFLYWLENMMKQSMGEVTVTERSAADKIEQLRAEQAEYVGLSFETISAVGAHSARPHYKLTESSNVPLSRHDVYLIDSGAHYRDGTTDVTRTVCFDGVSAYQKKCFTLVLKGHIQMAMQKFPEQTAGIRLDTLSRQALWNSGLDFRHGTGHGVGHYLNVHEGPIGIGYNHLSLHLHGILENMILTIEPGYYEGESFGIRIENVYVVVACQTEHSFPDCRFLTFQPLTLVPIQKRFLDASLLTAHELQWLNNYHDNCLDKVGPMLEVQGKGEALKWLQEQCKPLG